MGGLAEMLEAVEAPGQEELGKAARELFLWQDKEALSAAAIADGTVAPEGAAAAPLTPHDCHLLGKAAFDDGDDYHCALWMEEALKRLPTLADNNDDRVRPLYPPHHPPNSPIGC